MTKIPTDLSGRELVKRLGRLGYAKVRQEGSHMTCTTLEGGEHHAYIPDRRPLKVGTLRKELRKIAGHFSISVSELLKRLEL